MATITRNEVASMLGVSAATVRRMEGKSLHPRMVDGAWRFELDEVKDVQRAPDAVGRRTSSEGEIAAEIFWRFDQGQSLRQIVRECRLAPKVVQRLYADWATPLGATREQAADATDGLSIRDEDELAAWEETMRAMIAADGDTDIQERLVRQARRRRRVSERRGRSSCQC